MYSALIDPFGSPQFEKTAFPNGEVASRLVARAHSRATSILFRPNTLLFSEAAGRQRELGHVDMHRLVTRNGPGWAVAWAWHRRSCHGRRLFRRVLCRALSIPAGPAKRRANFPDFLSAQSINSRAISISLEPSMKVRC